MGAEVTRGLININGVSVPGFFRDGAYLAESPVETFILFRSGGFSANQSKTFMVDFAVKPKTVLVSDTNSDTVYTFLITTAEGVVWTLPFTANNVLHCKIIGNTKLIDFPSLVLDRGTKIAISPNKAIQGVALFVGFAANSQIEDF